MKFQYNHLWGGAPKVSVITPVFNRRNELPRALKSLERQTFRDIEHIIINDGSSEPIDDIVYEYMSRVDYPVSYITKENGGVHTARNAGIKISRGEMMTFLDSDDEYFPHSIQTFIAAWHSIPEDLRKEYRECNAFCVDQDGKRIGGHLSQNINELPYVEAKSIVNAVNAGDKIGFFRGDLMRASLWPEPEGVKVVAESIMWCKLGYTYKTWFLDDELLVYHRESNDSLTNRASKLKEQNLINSLYNSLWFINNGRMYGLGKKELIINAVKFSTFKHLLKMKYLYPNYEWAQSGTTKLIDKIVQILVWLPTLVLAVMFQYRYTKQ